MSKDRKKTAEQKGKKSPASRLFLMCVALLYITAHLSSLAHLAFVRHAICAEHGEMVDVAVPTVTVRRGEPANSVVASRHLAAEHEHAHCTVAAYLKHQVTSGVSGCEPAPASVVEEVVVAESRAERSAPTFRLYLLAPKTSPPV